MASCQTQRRRSPGQVANDACRDGSRATAAYRQAGAGGSDELDNLAALCRACHHQTDAPFSKGRLVVRALGGGIFTFDLVHAVSKWDARRAIAGTEDEPKSTPAATSSPLARSSHGLSPNNSPISHRRLRYNEFSVGRVVLTADEPFAGGNPIYRNPDRSNRQPNFTKTVENDALDITIHGRARPHRQSAHVRGHVQYTM